MTFLFFFPGGGDSDFSFLFWRVSKSSPYCEAILSGNSLERLCIFRKPELMSLLFRENLLRGKWVKTDQTLRTLRMKPNTPRFLPTSKSNDIGCSLGYFVGGIEPADFQSLAGGSSFCWAFTFQKLLMFSKEYIAIGFTYPLLQTPGCSHHFFFKPKISKEAGSTAIPFQSCCYRLVLTCFEPQAQYPVKGKTLPEK